MASRPLAHHQAGPKRTIRKRKSVSGYNGGRRKRARYDGEQLLFAFEVAGLPAWTEADGRFTTRAGTLRVAADADLPPTSVVKLGEETVFQAEQMYITLYCNYPFGAQDVVLIGTKSGGTCCPYDQLSLLVLESGKSPRVLSDDGFITIDGTQEPELKPRRLEVDLGFDGGKRKLARFDGRDLSIAFADRGRPPLTEADCKLAHEGMLQCADHRSDDPHCEDPARFSGVIGRSVIPILQQPGLNQRGFTEACVAACKSGETPPFDAAFRESVCCIGRKSRS
jgi:hypothetical protein